MTSIRYVKTPNVTKLDGRFKFYNRGFKYRVSFNTQGNYDPYSTALKWCQNTYGPEYTWDDAVAWTRKIWNNDWRVMIPPKNKWWREIYLRDEQAVTMLLLVIGG